MLFRDYIGSRTAYHKFEASSKFHWNLQTLHLLQAHNLPSNHAKASSMAGRHPLAEDADDTDDFYAQLSAAAEQADTAADAAAESLAADGSLRSLRQLLAQVCRTVLARRVHQLSTAGASMPEVGPR